MSYESWVERCLHVVRVSLPIVALPVDAIAATPAVVSTFADDPGNGTYAFASWTPKTLGELIQRNKTGDTVNIIGRLYLPAGVQKASAVVLASTRTTGTPVLAYRATPTARCSEVAGRPEPPSKATRGRGTRRPRRR